MIGRITTDNVPQLQQRLLEWLRSCASPQMPWPYEWAVGLCGESDPDGVLLYIRTWVGNGLAKPWQVSTPARLYRHIRTEKPLEPFELGPSTRAVGPGYMLGDGALELSWVEGDTNVLVGLLIDADRIEGLLRQVARRHVNWTAPVLRGHLIGGEA
jgi:hypothetical protein